MAEATTGAHPEPQQLTESEQGKKDQLERIVRWQKIAIDQLGYALNLTLTLTTAALGYFFVLLKDKDFIPGSSAKCALLWSLSALALSALCGIACVISRLLDFRGTARRTRNHPDAPSQDELRFLGRTTVLLFYVHLLAFALGIAALAVALLITYGGKLA